MAIERHHDASRLAPLQFGTRGLLAGTAACAVLVVVLQHLSALWGMTLLWFIVLVIAHMAATVLGTLRSEQTDEREHDKDFAAVLAIPRPIRCAPATRLRASNGFGRVLLIVIASCAAVGLVLGTAAFWLVFEADSSGIVLGGISAAILAGFFGFATGSFVMVATRAFREATTDPHQAISSPSGNPR